MTKGVTNDKTDDAVQVRVRVRVRVRVIYIISSTLNFGVTGKHRRGWLQGDPAAATAARHGPRVLH
eukprot:COSAG05_NODE_4603_length_1442_cov_1.318690_3_plen_66_part_00